MTAPLPELVTIFGIEAHGELGTYCATDPESGTIVSVEIYPELGWWAGVDGKGPYSFSIEGPVCPTPELAVAALHDLVRKLAVEIK